MKLFIVINFALVLTVASSARSGKPETANNHYLKDSGNSNSNSSCLNDVYSCFENNELLFSSKDSQSISWPKNDSAITKLCTELQSTIFCLRDEVVADCSDASAYEKDTAEQVVSAIELYYAAVCPSPSSRSAFLRQTACYNDADVSAKVLAQLKIFSQLLTLGSAARCCSALHFKEAIGKINAQHCQSEVASYVNGLVDDVLGPNIESCHRFKGGKVSSSAVCQDSLPGELKRQFAVIIAKEQSRQAKVGLGSSSSGDLFRPRGFSERDGRENGDNGGWSLGEIFHLAKLVSMMQTQHPFFFHMFRAVWDYCINNDCLQ